MKYNRSNFRKRDNKDTGKVIHVVGIGESGIEMVNHMINMGLNGVIFFSVSYTRQSLQNSMAREKIFIGINPDGSINRNQFNALSKNLGECNLMFIVSGFGFNTTDQTLTQLVESRGKALGTLITVAIITTPSTIKNTELFTDSIIEIPVNQDSFDVVHKTVSDTTELAHLSVKAISDLITKYSFIGIDFSDIATSLKNSGIARVGTGLANGKDRAMVAAKKALGHIHFENINLSEAKEAIINITFSSHLTSSLEEWAESADLIYEYLGDEIDIIWSAVEDESIGDNYRVTLIIAGINQLYPPF